VLPARLEDLASDPRFPQARRHIRKLYPDPLSPTSEWGLIKQGNALIGVYSQAVGVPFRTAGFADANVGFENATSYADWRFKAKVFSTPPAASAPSGFNPAPQPGTRNPPR
jgi:hypothetical protein